jgi:hypothetical protein
MTVNVGTVENPQNINLDLTTSFDGLALPSKKIATDGGSYNPEASITHREA